MRNCRRDDLCRQVRSGRPLMIFREKKASRGCCWFLGFFLREKCLPQISQDMCPADGADFRRYFPAGNGDSLVSKVLVGFFLREQSPGGCCGFSFFPAGNGLSQISFIFAEYFPAGIWATAELEDFHKFFLRSSP